jgi:uracil-DNA glycosylase family 4
MELGGITGPSAEIASLLTWWEQAGVDVFVDEATRDWLAPVERRPAPVPAPQIIAPAAPTAPQPARPTDALPASLDAFQAWLADHGELPVPPAQRIAPAGDAASGLMLLVDQPEPDDTDMLMGGVIGTLFDRMLAAIGRDRSSLYLAAMAPGRPAGGYIDAASADLFTRLTRHHVALARPKLLLLMGEGPSRALLRMGFVEARGRVHEIDLPGGPYKAIATFHPRTLIQHPAQKARAWADLQLLMKILES